MATVLSTRALNRATLERQLLTRRQQTTAVDVIEHLVGLQAQTPHTWYVGLWNRIRDFDASEASTAMLKRDLVRIALMRSTIHLVSARDCLWLRPLVAPVIERSTMGSFGKGLAGLDRVEFCRVARAVLDAEPMTFAALGERLSREWPDRDKASLAQAARAWLPLVQVPPRGLWGRSGPVAHTTAEAWLGRPLETDPSRVDLVRRYLAAFGPASVKDVQTWSGLTRLREVVDDMRSELVVFRDEDGRELFDLPDAPRPGPDIEVPARLLYDFDNLLLSHDDRSRVITPEYLAQNFDVNGPVPRIVLVDGVTSGTWRTERVRGVTTMTVRPFTRWSAPDADAVAREAGALLRFLAPGDTHELVVARS